MLMVGIATCFVVFDKKTLLLKENGRLQKIYSHRTE